MIYNYKHFNGSKAFVEYSNNMDDIYKNIEEYNPNKKREILIIFNDMIADMLSNKKLNPIVTELFIRDRKLSIFLAFIIQSYFAVPKNIRLNSTHCFIMKIPNKQKLNKFNLIILVIDATLASVNPLRFRKNLLERIQKLIMTINAKMRYEKLQCDINRANLKTKMS